MIKRYITLFLFITISYCQLLDKVDSNAFKSLLLPGLGEYNLNEDNRSKNFFITEACLWLSFFSSYYGNQWYTDNYMSFGSYHADIDLDNIPSNQLSMLIVHMSQYDNMEFFNETMDRQRRNNSYSDESIYGWNWDNDKNRKNFNDLRIKSSNLKKINNFTISALIINRLVSFFDVIYLSDKKYKISSSISPTIGDGLILNCNINF
ncbi:MAG: hypothetical protein CMG21_00050 [Candidatus Marinimicrobia bacterium]|nr:hypothetical protein [Candidatus Neomarinimicrobiota bacterium]|tara:strand:- start:102 stop:719 length:618 start_codon:yes stop_codon:yes gene_type:complete